MKLTYVQWSDSYGCSSRWGDLDPETVPEELVCQSVGWVVYETSKVLTLVPHISPVPDQTVQGCGDMTIPKCAIKKIIYLEKEVADQGDEG